MDQSNLRTKLEHPLGLCFDLANQHKGVRIPAVNATTQGQAVSVVIDEPPILNGNVLHNHGHSIAQLQRSNCTIW